jgi:hypothetical protein
MDAFILQLVLSAWFALYVFSRNTNTHPFSYQGHAPANFETMYSEIGVHIEVSSVDGAVIIGICAKSNANKDARRVCTERI